MIFQKDILIHVQIRNGDCFKPHIIYLTCVQIVSLPKKQE